jgi:hypothetical protein
LTVGHIGYRLIGKLEAECRSLRLFEFFSHVDLPFKEVYALSIEYAIAGLPVKP